MIKQTIEFGAHGDFLSIQLNKRPFPDAENAWDRDAIDVTVTISAGVFDGEFETTIWSHELTFLLNLLKAMDKSMGKETEKTFKFREGTILFTFRLTKTGVIEIPCTVCDNPSGDTKLNFTIGADQSYLSQWIEQIAAALKTFPQVLDTRQDNELL